MIAIVDYGLGNLKAFENVYRKLSIPTCYASTPEQLLKANKIILPGVGAFDHAISKLNSSGLRETLDYLVLENKVPVIGICVGMQIMANDSEEGNSNGLGWINGKVKRLSNSIKQVSKTYPLPHMGWNNISPLSPSALLSDLDKEKKFYFLHSFYFECAYSADIIATTNYGFDFPSIVNHENVFGIQCHPEKSHHNGITFLKNFAEL